MAQPARQLGCEEARVLRFLILCASIGHYLDFYNRGRPHSSLDGAIPDQAYFTRCLSAWQLNPGVSAATIEACESSLGLSTSLDPELFGKTALLACE